MDHCVKLFLKLNTALFGTFMSIYSVLFSELKASLTQRSTLGLVIIFKY